MSTNDHTEYAQRDFQPRNAKLRKSKVSRHKLLLLVNVLQERNMMKNLKLQMASTIRGLTDTGQRTSGQGERHVRQTKGDTFN